MARWKYVGPVYAKGVLVNDGTLLFPESLTDDDHIESILLRYPDLAPYWRDTTNDPSDGGTNLFVPLSRWDVTADSIAAIFVKAETFLI